MLLKEQIKVLKNAWKLESLRIDQIPDQEQQQMEYKDNSAWTNLRGYAGGGIAKEAGDRSGAMTTSMNPDSQGLS